jgi:hypothetical protein
VREGFGTVREKIGKENFPSFFSAVQDRVLMKLCSCGQGKEKEIFGEKLWK